MRGVLQIVGKKLSNLVFANDHRPVTASQRRVCLIERNETINVPRVGSFNEDFLKVIWFYG